MFAIEAAKGNQQLREQMANAMNGLKSLGTARPPYKSVYWKTIFVISHPKHMLWVLKNRLNETFYFESPKHMFKLMGKKIITILH